MLQPVALGGWTHQMPIGAVGNLAKTGCAENGPTSNPPTLCYGCK